MTVEEKDENMKYRGAGTTGAENLEHGRWHGFLRKKMADLVLGEAAEVCLGDFDRGSY